MENAGKATPSFRFSHPLRVRWAEVDRQGIVFNGHYLTYFDVGITEYWRAIGLPYPANVEGTGIDLFTVKNLINYHAPAEYDDLIDIGVRVARLGNSSITFAISITRNTTPLISGEVVYVCADPQARQSRPIPQNLRQAIERFELHPG